jgi:hypothetical protein
MKRCGVLRPQLTHRGHMFRRLSPAMRKVGSGSV